MQIQYCRTHNVRVCLYIAYIACGSATLCIETLYFSLTVLALSLYLGHASYVCSTVYRYYKKVCVCGGGGGGGGGGDLHLKRHQ